MSGRPRHRSGSVGRWVIAVVAVALVVGAAFWAGRVTTRADEQAEQTPRSKAAVEVVEQELGRVITLTTTVTRPSTPLAVNSLAGTVTEVSQSGELGSGDPLYTVGDTPVVLIEGAVPFWRELGEGVEGADVTQVQDMLTAAGVADEGEADAEWDAEMTETVREWQRAQGHTPTGVFPLGALVSVPELPVAVSIDAGVAWPGAVLAGGEEVVSVSSGDPAFAMEVTQTQAEILPPGTEVTVQGGESEWEGVITDSTTTEDGLFLLSVTAPDGGLVCGEECEQLPAAESTTLLTQASIVPPVTGPVVPISAVSTQPDGSSTVDVISGEQIETTTVQVRTVADGLAVVDGVVAGDRVRVFGEDGGSLPAAPGGDLPGPDEGTTTEQPGSPPVDDGGGDVTDPSSPGP